SERRAADLECPGREVRAVRVKLLGGGHTFRARSIHAERHVSGEPSNERRRQARRRRIEGARAPDGFVTYALGAGAERDVPTSEIPILEHEHAGRSRVDRRQERLLPDRRELPFAKLRAERTVPRGPWRVQHLDPALVSVAADERADLAAFDLDVPVVVDSEPQLDPGKAREPDPVRANVDPRLLEVDPRARVVPSAFVPGVVTVERRVFTVLVARVRVTRHAVAAVEAADGQPDRRALADPRGARRRAAGPKIAVRHDSGRRVVVVMPEHRFDRDLVIVGRPARAVEVPRDRIRPAVDPDCGRARARRRIAAQLDGRVEAVLRRRGRDPVRDRIDDSADRAAAVEQSRRTAKDLDLLSGERVDADGVIDADAGDVERVDAVLHDFHAGARETADHGARGAGTEERGADAELAGERLAEGIA